MVADSLIPPSRLSYGSGRSTSCQRVRHAAYLSERDPSEPRRSNSFTRWCRLRHRVDDQLDRLHVCCRSQSVSERGRTDDAFSRRASHASISTLDVRTGRFWANSISTRLRSRRDCSKASVPASALPLHWAVPFTVQNLPTGWPARYRIATPTLICCGTVRLRGHGDGPALQCKRESRPVANLSAGRDTYDMPTG